MSNGLDPGFYEMTTNLSNVVRVGKAPSFPDIRLSNLVARVTASRWSRGTSVTTSAVIGVFVRDSSLYVALQFCECRKGGISRTPPEERQIKGEPVDLRPSLMTPTTLPLLSKRLLTISCFKSSWCSPEISITSSDNTAQSIRCLSCARETAARYDAILTITGYPGECDVHVYYHLFSSRAIDHDGWLEVDPPIIDKFEQRGDGNDRKRDERDWCADEISAKSVYDERKSDAHGELQSGS